MDAKQAFAAEIARIGGPAFAAKSLGITRQAITGWLERGEAPIRRCIPLAGMGADLRKLRPTDWQCYWPVLDIAAHLSGSSTQPPPPESPPGQPGATTAHADGEAA